MADRVDIVGDRGLALSQRLVRLGEDWSTASFHASVRTSASAAGLPILDLVGGEGVTLVYAGTALVSAHIAAGRLTSDILSRHNPATGRDYDNADSLTLSIITLDVSADDMGSTADNGLISSFDTPLVYDVLVTSGLNETKEFYGTFTVQNTVTRPFGLLPNWKALVAAAEAGTSGGALAAIGNSVTTGFGGNTIKDSYPYKLYQTLLSEGLPVLYNACWGEDHWVSDSRVVLSGGALAGDGSFQRISPGYDVSASGATVTFTPETSYDTIDIYYNCGGPTATGAADVKVGGVTQGSFSVAGPLFVTLKLTITVPLTSAPIAVVRTAGPSVFFTGIDAYNSAAKKIRILGFGQPGETAGYLASATSYSVPQFISLLDPALTILETGINDWEQGVALATFQANLQSLIDNIKPVSDLILIGPNGTGGVASDATQLTFNAAIEAKASANGLLFMDVRDINASWVNYTAANAAGKMSDITHPNATGYADIGPAIAELL